MVNKGRILAVIVAIFLVVTQFHAVFAAPVVNDFSQMTRDQEILGYLALLGIIDEDDVDGFTNEDTITKGEATYLIIRSLGFLDLALGMEIYTGFADLSPDHEYAGIVHLATVLGILSGHPGGILAIDEHITVEQAAKMLVTALGYGEMANFQGGWPMGYLMQATRLRLASGTGGVSNQPMSRLSFALMLHNSFNVEMMRTRVFGIDTVDMQTREGDTLEAQFLRLSGFVMGEGIVEANRITNIGGSNFNLNDDEVVIDGVRLNNGGTAVGNHIGYHIQYVARTDDRAAISEVAGFRVTRQNVVRLLPRSTYPTFTNNRVEYYDEAAGRTRQLNVSPNVVVIFNNRMLDSFTAEDLDFSDGNVLVIDNDNDGMIDVIRFTRSESFVVSNISVRNEMIYVQGQFRGSAVIDMRENSDRTVIVRTVDGEPANWHDIRIRDAISIVESEDRLFLEIILLPPPFIGSISEMQDGEWVVINDERYYVTSQLENAALGRTGRFWVDENGEIFRFEVARSEFVYVINKTSNFGGLDSSMRIQVYDNYYGLNIYQVHERVMINGDVFANAEAAFNNIQIGTVASLVVSADGVVREITYANHYGGRANREYLRLARGFRALQGRQDMPFKFNVDTEFFVVPYDSHGNSRLEDFGMVIDFRDAEQYDVQAFELDEDTGYVRAIVIRINPGDRPGDEAIGIVTRVSQAMDRSEQITFVIEGYSEGEPFRHYAAHDLEVFRLANDLRMGDVISFQLGFGGEIEEMERFAQLATQREFQQIGVNTANARIFGPVMILRQAEINNASRFLRHYLQIGRNMSFDQTTSVHIYAHTENPDNDQAQFNDFYVFDRTRNTVTPATVDDIVSFQDNPLNPSIVFVQANMMDANILVIVRD
ncbi:MAG: hypothetical protein FWE04_07455 [Oscillospiraceae bacterium]|nr:hypothetical protein [Oscillospiraceae bacterium]